jgi:hypothetical protein
VTNFTTVENCGHCGIKCGEAVCQYVPAEKEYQCVCPITGLGPCRNTDPPTCCLPGQKCGATGCGTSS